MDIIKIIKKAANEASQSRAHWQNTWEQGGSERTADSYKILQRKLGAENALLELLDEIDIANDREK